MNKYLLKKKNSNDLIKKLNAKYSGSWVQAIEQTNDFLLRSGAYRPLWWNSEIQKRIYFIKVHRDIWIRIQLCTRSRTNKFEAEKRRFFRSGVSIAAVLYVVKVKIRPVLHQYIHQEENEPLEEQWRLLQV